MPRAPGVTARSLKSVVPRESARRRRVARYGTEDANETEPSLVSQVSSGSVGAGAERPPWTECLARLVGTPVIRFYPWALPPFSGLAEGPPVSLLRAWCGRTSAGRTSSGRTSMRRTSAERTSARRISAERTSAKQTSRLAPWSTPTLRALISRAVASTVYPRGV
jgi:hypothetical protein